MKAIVVVVVVLSENRAEGLVRPVYRGDGRGDSRDAPRASSAAVAVLVSDLPRVEKADRQHLQTGSTSSETMKWAKTISSSMPLILTSGCWN
jgi:hypothetical protein